MRVVRQITYEGSTGAVRQVVDHSLPDGVCDFVSDPQITCKTVEGDPPDPEKDRLRGHTFGDNPVDKIVRAMNNLGDGHDGPAREWIDLPLKVRHDARLVAR